MRLMGGGITPECNRSIPGILKNAIDHDSRPYGQSVWTGKPAGVLDVSVGAIGTAMAQQRLRNILAFFDMSTLCQPEVFVQVNDNLFDEKGDIGLSSKQFFQNWINQYVSWVKSIRLSYSTVQIFDND